MQNKSFLERVKELRRAGIGDEVLETLATHDSTWLCNYLKPEVIVLIATELLARREMTRRIRRIVDNGAVSCREMPATVKLISELIDEVPER